MNSDRTPRIVIYGTGQYGQYITRFAVQKGWTIVAAFNHAGDKVGKDLGRLAGLDRDLGIIIQDCDTADYSNLDADIGIVATTNFLKINQVADKRLLGAGLNVLCHGGESYYPWGTEPEIAKELDELAKKNNVTFTGSGIWDMSRIWSGILVTGPCTEINSLFHSSLTDIEGQVVVKEHGYMVGLTYTMKEFEQKGLRNSPVAKSYRTITEHVLVALGYTIAKTNEYTEPVTFDKPIYSRLMECEIPAGDCVGVRMVGEVETKEGVTARSEVVLQLFQESDVEHMYWSVDGKPRSSIRTERKDSDHATAGCLFNRIPDVINARPGIVLVSELGPLKHSALA